MYQQFFKRNFWTDLYKETNEDNTFQNAAALAFYLMLSIFPAVILIMALIPYLPIPNVDQAIMDFIKQSMPAQASGLFANVVQQVTDKSQNNGGLISFGILGTLWATSSGMYAVMQALNVSYDVPEGRSFFKARLVALALSVAFVVLVVVAFTLIVLGGVMQDWINNFLGGPNQAVLDFFAILRWVIILVALLGAYALTYYYAPHTEQKFKFVIPGSIIGAALLIIASLAFSWYVQNFSDYSAVYGSIGAVIALMMWLYIVGITILTGSEVNALVEDHSGQGKHKGERAPGVRATRPAHSH